MGNRFLAHTCERVRDKVGRLKFAGKVQVWRMASRSQASELAGASSSGGDGRNQANRVFKTRRLQPWKGEGQ